MFNLDDCKRGMRMLTREGMEAVFICILSDERIPARLIVEVETGEIDSEGYTDFLVQSYYLNGKFFPDCDSEMDLQTLDKLEFQYDWYEDGRPSELAWLIPTPIAERKLILSPKCPLLFKQQIYRLLKESGFTVSENSAYYYKPPAPDEVRDMVKKLS